MRSFYKPTIATREEFHRVYAGELSIHDFCTERTNQRHIPPYTPEERKVQSERAKIQNKNNN